MKKKTNHFNIILAFLALNFFIGSCSKETTQQDLQPIITSISPETGSIGSEVTIIGENFSNNKDEVYVVFDAKSAEVIESSNTKLKVKAPSGFNNTVTNIIVAINGEISNAKTFTYSDQTPTISSISPESGEPGNEIIITGSKFGTDLSKVDVRFNDVKATSILSVDDTEIKVEIPEGFSDEKVNVKVSVSDLASNIIEFYYLDTATPLITTITATCFYNSTVVIEGNDFSTEEDGNIVKFGDKEANIITATKNTLTVITPNLGSATSAEVTVTKNNDKVSNVKNITVDVDQNKVATYNWTEQNIKPGVLYKTGEFTLFGSSKRRIHILDVTLNTDNILGIGVATPHKNTVAICNDYDAIVGVNAGYFPLGSSSDKDPYIRINGSTVQDGHTNVSPIFTNSALLIHDNIASVRKFTDSGRNLNLAAAGIPNREAENIIVCGPMLITSGTIENLDMSQSHNSSSTGRTGLGVTEDGKRVFMVVIDYNDGVIGMSTPQLAKVLQALGAVNAMNLDGGGSSTMFVKNQGDNGRVSTNSYSQRAVKSIIYVK